MARLTPLTITGRLQQGVAMDSRFGIALDGLLASQTRKTQMAAAGTLSGAQHDGGTALETPTEVDLPLARCPHDPWHWLATTAYPLDWDHQPLTLTPDVHHLRYAHQREIAEQIAFTLPKHTHIHQGRFRSRRLPVVTFPAAYVAFRAVGDADAIRTMLAGCPSIGGHRHTGEGAVLEWTVTTHPDEDPDRWGHTHCDGTLGRPAPQTCVDRLDLDGPTGKVGIRPPVWHPATQHQLTLPTYPSTTNPAAAR